MKHGHAQHDYYPKISPLYTAERFKGKPDGKERMLLDISEIIGGSEENGRKLWEVLAFGIQDLSETDIKEAVKKVFGKEL